MERVGDLLLIFLGLNLVTNKHTHLLSAELCFTCESINDAAHVIALATMLTVVSHILQIIITSQHQSWLWLSKVVKLPGNLDLC